jgi:predicted Zn-dependent peptidase
MTSHVRRELREQVPSEAYYAMYRAPAEGTDEIEAVDIACEILGGSESSRLVQRLVREDQLAQHASIGVNRLIGGTSAVFASARARTGASLEVLEKTMLAEIAQLASDGPTEDELEIAKAQLTRQFLDATSTCAGLADKVSECATFFGDPLSINRVVDRLEAVTAEQVRDAAATWLGPENRAVLTYHLDPAGSAA